MTLFVADDYGPALSPILASAPLNELGPGNPIETMREKLETLSPDAALAPHKVVDRKFAQACLAGLWLRFDFLDESHALSQEIHNSTGSFWHGILHRREPDYDNAKYWFRRVPDHPIYPQLCAAAQEIAHASKPDPLADFLATQGHWDPFRFIDLVAAVVRGKSSNETLCRQIQRREWELLFDFCYRGAVGPSG